MRWHDYVACHRGWGTKLSLKEKFKDGNDDFDGWRTKLSLGRKFEDPNAYSAITELLSASLLNIVLTSETNCYHWSETPFELDCSSHIRNLWVWLTTQLEILYHFQCVIRSSKSYKYVYDPIWSLRKHAELGCLIHFYCEWPDDSPDFCLIEIEDGSSK